MDSRNESYRTLGYVLKKEAEVKLPQSTRVKNKSPSSIQITAAQILREARDCQESATHSFKKHKIIDSTELADYRLLKRKEFEDMFPRAAAKYAKWEESQGDIERARSVWKRVLEVDYKNDTLWVKYAQMEMRNKSINHARNVLDHAVVLLPRVDRLWVEYIHMEEKLGNVAGARQVLERWMQWQPDERGWLAYIKFELRYNEVDRARAIYERFVCCHPKIDAWISYAEFEMKNGVIARARNCYERAVDKLADDEGAAQLFLAFASFEERCKEIERARCIYKLALENLSTGQAEEVYEKLVAFEAQYGLKESIDDAIVEKRRFQYEYEVRKNPLNYDTWFDYIRLEESAGDKKRIREVYDRAVVNVPPSEEKRYWRRYIYLW